MKRVIYKQEVSKVLKAQVIMPTYGNVSGIKKAELQLPMTIERLFDFSGWEPKDKFYKRVQKESALISTKIKKKYKTEEVLWTIDKFTKPRYIKHDYYIEANKQL